MNKKTRITSVCSLALLCAMLSGCGIWQGMKDGTVEATKSVFYTKLKILKIDLIARNGLNQNERGQSLSTVVRVYQLKDKQKFMKVASYRDFAQSRQNHLEQRSGRRLQAIYHPAGGNHQL